MTITRAKDIGLKKVGNGTAGSFATRNRHESETSLGSNPGNDSRAAILREFPDATPEQLNDAVEFMSDWEANNPWGNTEDMMDQLSERFTTGTTAVPEPEAPAVAETAPDEAAPAPEPATTRWFDKDTDLVLASVERNPDDYLESFCELNPEVPPGKARGILHRFAEHVTAHPESTGWQGTMRSEIERQKGADTRHPFKMTPGGKDLDEIAFEISWAASQENPETARNSKLLFHDQLAHLSAQESDHAFDSSVALKKVEHEDWQKPLLDALRKNAQLKLGGDADFDYTYQPPGSRSVEGYMGDGSMGNLYAGYRDITSINKDARAEFARAQKAGYLPRDLKISVRGSKYSGGQSMTVSVKGVDESSLYEETPHGRRYTDAGIELRRRMEGIADSWNLDRSNSQVDYFDVTYYSHVNFED